MGIPYWAGEFAYQWDQLWLGGQLFPGIAQLSGPGIKRKLDEKNPKGASGASLTDEGDELAHFDVKLKLWTEAHKDEFERLLPDIHPRRKGGPKSPIEIYHPVAALLGIKNIYIEQIPFPEHDRMGFLVFVLKCIEWVPAPKPQKKAAGSSGGGWDPFGAIKKGLNWGKSLTDYLPPMPTGSGAPQVDNSGMEAAIAAILAAQDNTVDNSI